MQDEPEVVLEAEDDALSDAPDVLYPLTVGGAKRRVEGPKDEWRRQPHPLEHLADDATAQMDDVDLDVGELGHANRRRSRLLDRVSPELVAER